MSKYLSQKDLYSVLESYGDRLLRLENLLPVESWTEVDSAGAPVFENSWVNYDGLHNTAAFYKDPFGVVHLKGMVKSGTVPSTVFTLPTNYRPDVYFTFPVISNSAIGTVDVLDDGQVVVSSGSNVWLSLDVIRFRVDA